MAFHKFNKISKIVQNNRLFLRAETVQVQFKFIAAPFSVVNFEDLFLIYKKSKIILENCTYSL
jgi:hypothetical protein